MWSLERPAALALAALLPLLYWMAHLNRERGGLIDFSFENWRQPAFYPGFRWSSLLLVLTRAAFWGGLVLLIIALAGPVRVERHRSYTTAGLDILILLDQSPSMLAQDFSPHRFDAARQVIREFVQGLENDALGLISFGEEAVLRVPPTVDYDALLRSLESLTISGGLTDGTAIGVGLSLAVLHLQGSEAPGKLVVLLTDGENNAGEVGPLEAANAARELGIRVYTIGIGREGEARLELKDPDTGQNLRFTVRGRFDEALLREIAVQTGGRYFHASSPGVLQAIFDQIASIEGTERRARTVVQRHPRHDRFLMLGLILIGAGFLASKVLLREIL